MLPLHRAVGAAVSGVVLAAGCSSAKSSTQPSSSASSRATASSITASSIAASSISAAGSGHDVTLNLVAYSTPRPAYVKLIAAFQKTAAGAHVKFTQSYGPSGDQANSVVNGLPADVVEFSLETDMTKLVKKNLVAADWNSDQYKGFVTDSVVSFVVRKGNPKGIKDWSDLIKPGVKVLTPNPFSSGSARWNILGAYGSQIKASKTDAEALGYLKSLLHQVPVQDASGSKALTDFVGGAGDVLISYENEAIYARAKHQPVDYVIPNDTLLIESPVAVSSTSRHPTEAKAFVDFLHSRAGQQIFADTGYRPVLAGVTSSRNTFPTPSGLFTIKDLGGWTAATTKFFDPSTGEITAIEKSLGVATSK